MQWAQWHVVSGFLHSGKSRNEVRSRFVQISQYFVQFSFAANQWMRRHTHTACGEKNEKLKPTKLTFPGCMIADYLPNASHALQFELISSFSLTDILRKFQMISCSYSCRWVEAVSLNCRHQQAYCSYPWWYMSMRSTVDWYW